MAGAVETSAKNGTDTIDDAFFITVVNAIDIKEGVVAHRSRGSQYNADSGRVDTEGSQRSARSYGRISSATKTSRS